MYFRKSIRKVIAVFIIPLIFFCGFSILKKCIGIAPPYIAASISVPLQQIARVRNYIADENLQLKDKKIYTKIILPLKEHDYDPYCVDILKIDGKYLECDYIENSLRKDPERFINLYTKWAKEYPIQYIDAFLLLNWKYWYIKAKYKEHGLYFYLYTDNRWDDFFGVPIKMYSLFPKLKSFYNRIFLENSFSCNPIAYSIFSIAHNTWIVIFCFFILFYRIFWFIAFYFFD